MKTIAIVCMAISVLAACSTNTTSEDTAVSPPQEEVIYTRYSESPNEYLDFNSNDAINKIADIENEYFRKRKDSISRFYGTIWREQAEKINLGNGASLFEEYLNALPIQVDKPDSLHCTLYAYEGLKAGLSLDRLETLENHHRRIWKSREIAGWSVGYILVKFFNWKAYLILDPGSTEFDHCLKAYRKNKSYPVWKQPDIPLEDTYIIGQQDSLIKGLLMENEFGWGFSEQGIHTWITRFNILKECNWLGAPAIKYQRSEYDKPLFISTEFSKFRDYNSHVVIYPNRKLTSNSD